YACSTTHYTVPGSLLPPLSTLFFFTATPPTELYTLSLHDALPISPCVHLEHANVARYRSRFLHPSHAFFSRSDPRPEPLAGCDRSEEHTSELQSRSDLVCRLLLEKKNNTTPPAPLNAQTVHITPYP